MRRIVNREDFHLDAKITRLPRSDLISVELFQTWPKAQRPHQRRITQLNLNAAELLRFSQALIP